MLRWIEQKQERGDDVPSPRSEGEEFERSTAHQWATDFLERHAALLEGLQQLSREHAERLRAASLKRAAQNVTQRLTELPLADFAGAGLHLRLQPLIDQGIRTALDYLNLSPEDLNQIRGVGERTRTLLGERLSQARRLRAEDLRPPADPRTWTAADLQLAGSVELWAGLAALLGMPHVAAVVQLLKLARFVRRWTSWLGWAVSTPTRRAAVRSAYSGARESANSPDTLEAIGRLREAFQQACEQQENGVSASWVVDQWHQSSASLLGALEGFLASDGTAEEQTAIRRGLIPGVDPALVEQIENLDLDEQLLNRTLRRYQVFGAKFALVVERGLLGDDIGLGKSVEAIAAIAHATSAEGQRHHVVVCPAGLIDNWLQEFSATAAGIPCWAYRQPGREQQLGQWQVQGGVLLVSYDQAQRLAASDLPPLGFVIADEAHKVKNPETQRSQATSQLVDPAQRALLMSGTLLENRTEDIIALTELVDPVEGARLRRAFGDGREAHLNPEPFRHALGSFYLRRNQRQVLSELPEIVWTDEPIAVGPTEEAQSRAAIRGRNLMAARRLLTSAAGLSSMKIQRLTEIIEESRAENAKVLVFSVFHDVLDLALEVIGEDAREVSGRVRSPHRRQQHISWFTQTDGFAALVIQIDTGGEGLNLQSASRVVLMEPQYKPSTETQAVGRAHRMGQTQRVVVHRLVAKDTVDSRILERTCFKAELFNVLVGHSVLDEAARQTYETTEHELLEDELRRLDEAEGHQ